MPIVNTAVYDLKVGAHDEPTVSLVPNQGDWQWCMTEAAAWTADDAWSDAPASVSPVIAAMCNAINDVLDDATRQDLAALIDVAPDGIIDTVDGGKETAREWSCVDWLVRTLLPMWLDYSTDADVLAASTAIKALPALAAGTFDEAATLAALEDAGRAVWAWTATQRADSFEVTGGGGPTFAAVNLQTLYDGLGSDYVDEFFGKARGVSGLTSTGADDGQAAMSTAVRAADQATWDLSLTWVPIELFTGRSVDFSYRQGGDYVPGSAFILIRDTVFALAWAAAVTDVTLAAHTDPESGFGDYYETAYDAGQTQLVNLGADVDAAASAVTLIADLAAY